MRLFKRKDGGSDEAARAEQPAAFQIEIDALKERRDVDGLVEALREHFPQKQRAAADALGELGDPRAVAPMIAVLQEDDWGFVRNEITAALKAIGGPEAEKALAESSADSGGLLAGGILSHMAEPLAAMAKMPAADEVAAGSFSINVVGTYADAESAVKMGAMLDAAGSGYEVLAVMAVSEPNGTMVLEGRDADGRNKDLRSVSKPAVLFVPRETLPYLKENEALWARVQQVENE